MTPELRKLSEEAAAGEFHYILEWIMELPGEDPVSTGHECIAPTLEAAASYVEATYGERAKRFSDTVWEVFAANGDTLHVFIVAMAFPYVRARNLGRTA